MLSPRGLLSRRLAGLGLKTEARRRVPDSRWTEGVRAPESGSEARPGEGTVRERVSHERERGPGEPGGCDHGRKRCCISRFSEQLMLIIYKRNESRFTGKKSSSHHLNHVIRISITNVGGIWTSCVSQ